MPRQNDGSIPGFAISSFLLINAPLNFELFFDVGHRPYGKRVLDGPREQHLFAAAWREFFADVLCVHRDVVPRGHLHEILVADASESGYPHATFERIMTRRRR